MFYNYFKIRNVIEILYFLNLIETIVFVKIIIYTEIISVLNSVENILSMSFMGKFINFCKILFVF